MSLLKANGVQIGQSLTPTDNFVWYQPATPDGTIRLGNGNSGSVTDILTITSTGNATFTGSVVAAGTSTSSADLKLYEDTDNGTNYVALKAPASVASNVTWTLPSADGTNGQYLRTNGSGTLSFATVDALPSQSGNTGKYLKTDGSTASWESVASSGLFNTSISSATGYAATTSMAAAYTAAATAGKRYIVHSVHVTNISASSATVTGQLVGTTYSNIAFCDAIPVPAGTAVELLKKPKVLQPSDVIQLQASANSAIHATITIEEVTGTSLFGAGVDITSATTYVDLYTASGNSVIESILLSNDDTTNLDVKSTVVWTDGSNTIQGYFCLDMIVPNDATVEVLEQPKFLPNGHKIRVQSNEANRLEAIIAGKAV